MKDIRRRVAVIGYDSCQQKKCGNWLCEQVCPVNRTGKECITHEGTGKPIISEELCIGCQICERKCPFAAISIVNLSIDPGKPMHQYGQNLFRLHGIPLPREGAVVGIVGRNGIGKSTALKILSGEMVPNLGELDAKAGDGAKAGKGTDWAKVIEFFRGKEMHDFFERLNAKKIKISVKPQNVDALPKIAKGKVRELLKRVDERKKMDGVVKVLGLDGVLDNELGKLSGGELQKVAVAAAALKDAGFYFFDEPSSYLDIRERMRVAEFIRALAEEGAAVIVVEHDLILLDYLSDYVNLMYGKPAVFGIVSQPKGTREGINTYLEGYSRGENYRFRQYEIEFSVRAAREAKTKGRLAEWPALRKKFKNFNFTAEANGINRNEVIGILGPNAIGKSTFVKMIAGESEPDSGKVGLKLKVAYKPQYIQAGEWSGVEGERKGGNGDKTVMEMFLSVVKSIDEAGVKNNIIRPLEIDVLMDKKFSTLSGGEKQRVAIGLALAKESDLIVMDEPSAHLDVEQRLAAAKAIRSVVDVRGISALVVDHDLLFMDYLSDRLMVFEGEPAKHGMAMGPYGMEEGMNKLLAMLQISLRRDPKSKRPRMNKKGSQKDEEQKKAGKYYYE
ncbi:MAG: ribosome biogenesis/translation initiation ATPase RLI [Candidatus Diapherotrites archaeon]